MIQNVLANEIYSIINGFDLRFVIKQMFNTICKRIDLLKSHLSYILTFIYYTNALSSCK